MGKLRWLGLLMGITLLGVTGFQLYWLRQNYSRENRALTIKAELTFRETILQLQVDKLKLDGISGNGKDSGNGKFKIILHDKVGEQEELQIGPKEDIVSTINVIRRKLKDSLRMPGTLNPGMVITLNKTSVQTNKDSVQFNRITTGSSGNGEAVINLLYNVDSLQDSIRISEIDAAYRKALQEEKINIPFRIIRTTAATEGKRPSFKEITVGLAHPVTYRLELGNIFPYLLKQIIQPILFSILLLGITILSFVLLYRNLLKQRRLAALKNEFISNITHELKTPIATVAVAIEALKNFNAIDNPARTREYLDISQNELQRLGLLVDKVLKLSMFEKKEMDLKYEPVNLEAVVKEVVSSLKLQFEKNQATVTVQTEGDSTITGDRLHLLSVVFNLLDNSLKYSKGAPSIQIMLLEKEKEVQLSVTDNGIGIAPEYKEKLFDKFFRVPHGDTHNAKGYGLGLSYVAQVIRKHHGTIAVESQPGTGTTFSITFPKKPENRNTV